LTIQVVKPQDALKKHTSYHKKCTKSITRHTTKEKHQAKNTPQQAKQTALL